MIVLIGKNEEVIKEYARSIVNTGVKGNFDCLNKIPCMYRNFVTIFGSDTDGTPIITSNFRSFLEYLVQSDFDFTYRQVHDGWVRDMTGDQVRAVYGILSKDI